MTSAAGWVLVALAAVFVAVAVPVLLQLRKTLKMAEVTLETTGRHVNETLDQLSTTLVRLNQAADELQGGVERVSTLLSALGGLGDGLAKIRQTLGTVASFGSILGGAFLSAFGFGSHRKDRGADSQETTERQEETR